MVDISTEAINGKTVMVVHVPEAQPHDKPVFFKAQGLPKGAFRRIGSTDQHCTDDDLAVFCQGRKQESFDASFAADTTLDDRLPEAISDYRQSRAEANPDAEELRWTDEDLLQSLDCMRRNPQGAWQPTGAGLMLFGKPVALHRCFPMMRVDYIRVPGRDWVPQPDRRFDTIDLRDPLLRLIRRAQAAILDDLPKGFALEEGDLQRQDKPAIPLRVIREALVNALMHRSYLPSLTKPCAAIYWTAFQGCWQPGSVPLGYVTHPTTYATSCRRCAPSGLGAWMSYLLCCAATPKWYDKTTCAR